MFKLRPEGGEGQGLRTMGARMLLGGSHTAQCEVELKPTFRVEKGEEDGLRQTRVRVQCTENTVSVVGGCVGTRDSLVRKGALSFAQGQYRSQ